MVFFWEDLVFWEGFMASRKEIRFIGGLMVLQEEDLVFLVDLVFWEAYGVIG